MTRDEVNEAINLAARVVDPKAEDESIDAFMAVLRVLLDEAQANGINMDATSTEVLTKAATLVTEPDYTPAWVSSYLPNEEEL